ncbi:GNAT family N-acetyltransferase [Actinopolyspora halophila]|uniref:GNAT family N-acetyltransferase n=1 Tax=Actinopolyspora halophila TaxID=1850 RepID=UPI0012F7DC2F|nr:GNAT family N-acetyltransferase [Actinopolyspora halophila]
MTTVAAARSYEAEPVLLTFHEGNSRNTGTTSGAYLRTPPFPGQVAGLPKSGLSEVVTAVREHDPGLRSVTGPVECATAFAAEWRRRFGGSDHVRMWQRLYTLGELRPPEGVRGGEYVFTDEDSEWLARWRADYSRDAADTGVSGDPSVPALRSFMDGGRIPTLWTDGVQPVAMAFYSTPKYGTSRLGNVYTPSRHRGNGYGSAVTAAAATRARRAGADNVVLFTDSNDPISNSIYRGIGFVPDHDLVEVDLHRE